MAKPLDSDKIESARRANSKAERREQKRRGLHQEIAHNRGGNGVIIIPPPKKESPLQDTKNCVSPLIVGSVPKRNSNWAVLKCKYPTIGKK